MVTIKKPEEIEKLRRGGKILASVVKEVIASIKPGVAVIHLDRLAEDLIRKAGGRPSFKGFKGYPNATCLSVNEEVVHAIPVKDKLLKNGDIIGVDVGLEYDGLYTDMSRTVPVGSISAQAKKLIGVARKALKIGIKTARPGATTGDIGYAIQRFVEKQGFSVVRSLVGHGVGYTVHEEPRVPNFGHKGEGEKLQQGMVLALEPMVNIGQPEVATKEDDWTIVTADGLLSAHFEDTIVITKRGAEVLTQ